MNNNNNNEEKNKITVKKKSAMPIIAVGITWVLLSFILRIRNISTAILVYTAISVVVYFIMKQIFPPINVQIETKDKDKDTVKKAQQTVPNEDKATTPEETHNIDSEFIDRIDLYIVEIDLLNDSIKDEPISKDLDSIKASMEKMIKLLKNDKDIKKREEQLDQFLSYYLPTTVKILDSYRKIEKQGLTGENANETKKRIAEALPFIKSAFEKELDNMYKNEMLDITTDIDVLESMLTQEGLIDKNNVTIDKNKKFL